MRDAIDGARGLMPVLERREGAASMRSLREAISGLQLEYAKLAAAGGAAAGGAGGGGEAGGGGAGGGEAGGGEGGAGEGGGGGETPAATEEAPPGPGPAQRSGRLWVPGS